MMRSLRLRLFTWILISFVVGWLIISGFAWWRATTQANQLFDQQLARIADLLTVVTAHEAEEQDLRQFEKDLALSGVPDQPYFQVWSDSGHLLVRGPKAPSHPLSPNSQHGYSDEAAGEQRWRVYTRYTSDGDHRIQVAQAIESRRKQLRTFVRDSLTPLLLALPMSGLLLFAIEGALAPLRRLARQIGARSTSNLEPIDASRVPKEVQALVESINGLLNRLRASLEGYSRFTADAAHELRTPLAGVLTQIHAALDTPDSDERRQSLHQALDGLSRLNHLLEQLLDCARMEPDTVKVQFNRFDLSELVVEVASEYAPGALQRDINLELIEPGGIVIEGMRDLIAIGLRNLLDNAVRATPPGGSILLRLAAFDDSVRLEVEDSGKGIPDRDKALVFDRFQRLSGAQGQGSGLGLSIVKRALDLHGGTVSLYDRERGQGLRVVIEFPIKT